MTAGYPADAIRSARSFLFVPANRPDRFAKAAAAQPDIVLIDLEDAVAPAAKDVARGHLHAWLADGNVAMVRINAADTRWHDADLALVAEFAVPVMVAKAERAESIRQIANLGQGVTVVPLVESAAGVAAVPMIGAVDGVERLAFGNIDLANELGVDPDDRDALAYVRSRLVVESAALGLAPPIDGVTTVFDQPGAVAEAFAYVKRLGMSAKLCIHPAQVGEVHAAARPTAEEVAWARKIASSSGSEGSAVAVDGRMVDIPVVERARRILQAAVRP
jgi:citrate lyase subunit beta / citryl-CoA lyase